MMQLSFVISIKFIKTDADGTDELSLESISLDSYEAKSLAEMVTSGNNCVTLGATKIVNGLMLAQFEQQASQG